MMFGPKTLKGLFYMQTGKLIILKTSRGYISNAEFKNYFNAHNRKQLLLLK